jgi:hypothetical protein
MALLSYWRYGLVAALLAAAGVWHLTDKARAVDDAVELVRAENILAALAASEANRATEKALNLSLERVRHDFALQKTRHAAAVVVTAGRVRDLQTALADASAASSDPTAATGIDAALARIAGECAAALGAVDATAKEYYGVAQALQQYAASVRLKD